MSLRIRILTKPHSHQRYDTVGDYFDLKNGESVISVSKMHDKRYEFLVALHELVEMFLCRQRRISNRSIDRFDMAFEKARAPGNEGEPGDDPKAPYYREHWFATKIERLMAKELGVDWEKYEEHIRKVSDQWSR
jgi:hypothetical protein